MVEDHPDVVRDIASAGHEIGLHGYEHDHLSDYDAEALALLDKNLARVCSLLEDITGSRPQSFRAPYLSMITFHDWIVSGGNRLSLLGDCLAAARESGADIATIAQRPDWLSIPN